jgi:fibro-slime domain-containing protein
MAGTCPGNDSTLLCEGLTKFVLGVDGKPVANTERNGGLTCACQFTDWDKTPVSTQLNSLSKLPDGVTTSKCASGGSGEITVIKQANIPVFQSSSSFKQWYTDSSYSTKSAGSLELTPVSTAQNTYRFAASNGRTAYDDIHDIWLEQNGQTLPAGAANSLSSGFFPLEDASGSHSTKICNLWPYWTAPASCIKSQWDVRGGTGSPPPGAKANSVTGVKRNFYFTTEIHYLFRYAGGERIEFFGDDDLWVYVNGKLVLDLGAPHEPLRGVVTLAADSASSTIYTWDVVSKDVYRESNTEFTNNLGLVEGNTYELAIFHADQTPRDSNYQLTLAGFTRTVSECQPTCGDGAATIGEECDFGDGNEDGLYGGCTTACTFGPYCGDGKVDAEEQCDLGPKNEGAYGIAGCTPACRRTHYCGDGILDTAYGEACDAGPSGSPICDKSCQILNH